MSSQYRYHVFLSYSRGADVERWVHRYFFPQLEAKLTDFLGYEARIFLDNHDLRTGAAWARKIAEALRESVCLVPIWSPTYFCSPWCTAEWASFRERERCTGLTTDGLVVPVLWQEEMVLPSAAAATQYTDLSRYALTAPAFETLAEFVEFERQVKEFVKREVVPALKRAPDFDPAWDVVVPGEAAESLAGLPSRKLEELSDVAAIYHPKPLPIGRFVLAA